MERALSLGAAAAAALVMMGTARADAPRVVASIVPVHSLVSGVTEGVAEPELLIPGGASPHAYALRPSDAALLDRADVVFWIGDALETVMRRPLDSLAGDALVVSLAEAPGMRLLETRSGGVWAAHDHGHGHDDTHGDGETHAHHDDHAHEAAHAHADDDHGHDHGHDHDHAHETSHAHEASATHTHEGAHGHEHAEEHGHDDDAHVDRHGNDHGHEHGPVDAHVWLDPHNAVAMTRAIAAALSEVDPANAARYAANAEAQIARLEALEAEIEATLAPVRGRPFVVLHDAYQYFETAFGLNAAGAITVGPEQSPGAARLAEIRARLTELDAACVFAEPQLPPRLVDTVVAGLSVGSGTLDPLGADLTPGPGAYEALMRGLARDLSACLAAG